MSGIYIQNMKMPSGCGKCPCSIYGACDAAQRHLGEFRWSANARPKWCPFVFIPDHGRLIDAGDLYDGIDKKTTAFRADVDNRKISQATEFGYWGAIHDVRAVLTNAPTIIPADKEADK